MHPYTPILAITAAVAACTAPAATTSWSTDIEAARAQAAAEGKAVLIFFTGSDWCHFCNVLKRRVLDTPAFAAWGQEQFVCVEADLPKGNRITEQLRNQNNRLVREYKVGGFPTVVLTDAHGHALGGFTGGMTLLPDVKAALEPALRTHQHLLQAQAATTTADRARHLAAAYREHPDSYRKFNTWLQEALQQTDPTNSTGWHTTRAAEQQMQQLSNELHQHILDMPAMLACYDHYLSQAIEGNRPRILRLKMLYLNGVSARRLQRARAVEDVQAAKDLQLQAAECIENPTERAEVTRRIQETFARPESLLRSK